jgi:hypothetical protein
MEITLMKWINHRQRDTREAIAKPHAEIAIGAKGRKLY